MTRKILPQKELTQKDLKELFFYNPESGELINKAQRWFGRPIKIGAAAGTYYPENKCIRVCVNLKHYLAHRLIWLYVYGVWPTGEIDHIDQDRSNNRIDNLRDVSKRVNLRNKPKYKSNRSGVTGVNSLKSGKGWFVIINAEVGVRKHMGSFNDKFEAICCRKSAENKYGYHSNHGK